MPVRIFERRSVLEKITDYWCTGPKYLKMAGEAKEPVERLKYVMSFILSGLH